MIAKSIECKWPLRREAAPLLPPKHMYMHMYMYMHMCMCMYMHMCMCMCM